MGFKLCEEVRLQQGPLGVKWSPGSFQLGLWGAQAFSRVLSKAAQVTRNKGPPQPVTAYVCFCLEPLLNKVKTKHLPEKLLIWSKDAKTEAGPKARCIFALSFHTMFNDWNNQHYWLCQSLYYQSVVDYSIESKAGKRRRSIQLTVRITMSPASPHPQGHAKQQTLIWGYTSHLVSFLRGDISTRASLSGLPPLIPRHEAPLLYANKPCGTWEKEAFFSRGIP